MSRPKIEWVITDTESLRGAIAAMKKQRKMSLEDLYRRMGARLLNRFLRREQDDLYARTIISAVLAMEYELVIREPVTTKTQKRLAALREERKDKGTEEIRGRAMRPNPEFDPELPEPRRMSFDPRRDEKGKIIGKLTDEEKAQAEALLDQYGKY